MNQDKLNKFFSEEHDKIHGWFFLLINWLSQSFTQCKKACGLKVISARLGFTGAKA